MMHIYQYLYITSEIAYSDKQKKNMQHLGNPIPDLPS